MKDPQALSLRERKQRKTRQAIIDTAMALFAEQGFDTVTVSDIAAGAEVGRTTFFRYFADKQELLFADDEEILQAVTESIDTAARRIAPIGDCLEDALSATRAGLHTLSLSAEPTAWLPLRARLIRDTPALAERNLLKERRYMRAAVRLLVQHGSTVETATLAVGIAAACYWTAHATTASTPEPLAAAMESALQRVTRLDGAAVRDLLA